MADAIGSPVLSPVLVTPPAVSLLTVADAKIQSRIAPEITDEDGLLQAYIDAATQHLDGWSGILGRALITQTWRQDYACFATAMRLPLPPVQSIVSMTHYDGSNQQVTLDGSAYALRTDAAGPYVEVAPGGTWPAAYRRSDAVSITFVAGYGDAAADVPAPLRQAVRLLVAHWFEMREAVTMRTTAELPLGVHALVSPYRRICI